MSFVEKRLCEVCMNEFDAKEETIFDKLRNTWVKRIPGICPSCIKDGVKDSAVEDDVDDEDGIEVGEVLDDEQEDEIY